MADTTTTVALKEVAERIQRLRMECGYSVEKMADLTDVRSEEYLIYESGTIDLPFSFIHKCALAFDVEMMELTGGLLPAPDGYTVTRRGEGQNTAMEPGIEIRSIAPLFKGPMATPTGSAIPLRGRAGRAHPPEHHDGQVFDLVLEGRLKVKIRRAHRDLGPGDASSTTPRRPTAMIAVDGADCVFLRGHPDRRDERGVPLGARSIVTPKRRARRAGRTHRAEAGKAPTCATSSRRSRTSTAI